MRKLQRFFAEKALELVIAGVCLQLFTAAVAIWLANRPAILFLSGFAVLLMLIVFSGVMELRERSKRPTVGARGAFEVPRRAVIFTLGLHSAKPGSVVYLVHEQLKPEFVGFLGTPTTERDDIVKTICENLNLQDGTWKSEKWEPTEIREGQVKTSLIIDWLIEHGLTEKDIVLDLTGGTATMSVAAFIAAEDKRIDSEYVFSEFDSAKNQVVQGSQKPMLITRYSDLNSDRHPWSQ